MPSTKKTLIDAFSNFVCLLLGAMVGYGVGQALGFDVYSGGQLTFSLLGVLLIVAGGGLGLYVARL